MATATYTLLNLKNLLMIYKRVILIIEINKLRENTLHKYITFLFITNDIFNIDIDIMICNYTQLYLNRVDICKKCMFKQMQDMEKVLISLLVSFGTSR